MTFLSKPLLKISDISTKLGCGKVYHLQVGKRRRVSKANRFEWR
jgi:hypothetical protein